MVKTNKTLTLAAAFLAIIIGGSLLFGGNVRKAAATAATSAAAPSPGIQTPGDYQPRIDKAQEVLAQDPKDLQKWVQLGNDYFDNGQPAQAVSAYAKALELDPGNTDVLTDQGVCFKKLGQFEKAVANFRKVQSINPKDEQSLVNLGIVYAVDLQQPEKALKAWDRFLELNPESPASRRVRIWAQQLREKGVLDSCQETQ